MTDVSNNILKQEPIMGIMQIRPCGCRIALSPVDILCNEHALKVEKNVPTSVGAWWRWDPKARVWMAMPVFMDTEKCRLYWNFSPYFPVKDDGFWSGPVILPTWVPKDPT